jgi:hypothetical protein
MYTAKGHQRKAHDFAASAIVILFSSRGNIFSLPRKIKTLPDKQSVGKRGILLIPI